MKYLYNICMKKIKLLTNLIAGTALLSAAPIIATSCSNNDGGETLPIYFIGWDSTPASGITSLLTSITLKDKSGNLINFDSTPIKTIENNGSDANLRVRSVTEGTLPSITITPKVVDNLKLKLKIVAYKDTEKTSEGETYYVESMINVLTPITLSLDVTDAENVASYEGGVLTVKDRTQQTTVKLVANPTPLNSNIIFYAFLDETLINDEDISQWIQWNSINSWNLIIPANGTPLFGQTTLQIHAIAENQIFEIFTVFLKSQTF